MSIKIILIFALVVLILFSIIINLNKKLKKYRISEILGNNTTENDSYFSNDTKTKKNDDLNNKAGELIKKAFDTTASMPKFFQEYKKSSHATSEDQNLTPLILLVHSSAKTLKHATEALRDTKYRMDSATDGRVAWEKIIQNRPSIVIADMDIPGLKGFELVRRMRQDLRFSDIPVLLVTPKPYEYLEDASKRGVNGFLTNPYNSKDLLEQISYFLHE